MQLTLTAEQANALKRLLAMALCDSAVGAELVDTIGYDEMGHLIPLAENMGLDEAAMTALHNEITRP